MQNDHISRSAEIYVNAHRDTRSIRLAFCRRRRRRGRPSSPRRRRAVRYALRSSGRRRMAIISRARHAHYLGTARVQYAMVSNRGLAFSSRTHTEFSETTLRPVARSPSRYRYLYAAKTPRTIQPDPRVVQNRPRRVVLDRKPLQVGQRTSRRTNKRAAPSDILSFVHGNVRTCSITCTR